MATLKRELLLLLHGAHIFLDVGGLHGSSNPERSRISSLLLMWPLPHRR